MQLLLKWAPLSFSQNMVSTQTQSMAVLNYWGEIEHFLVTLHKNLAFVTKCVSLWDQSGSGKFKSITSLHWNKFCTLHFINKVKHKKSYLLKKNRKFEVKTMCHKSLSQCTHKKIDLNRCCRFLGFLDPWGIVERSGRILKEAKMCLVVPLTLVDHHKGHHENGTYHLLCLR